MRNLDSILKSKDITLSRKVCIVKATVFPVVMCKCESWTIKKAKCRRIDVFELWYFPLDCKEIKLVNPKGDQPWIFIGRTDTEAEALVLQPPDAKSCLNGKDLMLGKMEGKRRRGWQRVRRLDSITDSMDVNVSKLRETVKDREAWCAAVHGSQRAGHYLATGQQQIMPHESSPLSVQS